MIAQFGANIGSLGISPATVDNTWPHYECTIQDPLGSLGISPATHAKSSFGQLLRSETKTKVIVASIMHIVAIWAQVQCSLQVWMIMADLRNERAKNTASTEDLLKVLRANQVVISPEVLARDIDSIVEFYCNFLCDAMAVTKRFNKDQLKQAA